VPAETKSIRFSIGTEAPQRRSGRNHRQPGHLQCPALILWNLSHYTVTPHAILDPHFWLFVTIPAWNDSAR
jgi:hypothetical protein